MHHRYLLRALQFSCPVCEVSVGHYCRRVRKLTEPGDEMARYVHPERIAYDETGFEALKMTKWLSKYGSIFRESE